MKERYLYVDFESCKTESELRGYLDSKINRIKDFGYEHSDCIELVFDEYLKQCMTDTNDFYMLRDEYLKKDET